MLNSVRLWFAGKKTYALAAIFTVAVGALVFRGKLSPATCVDLLMFFVPLFVASLRAAIGAAQPQVVRELEDVAQMGAAYTKHDGPALVAAARQAALDGVALVHELNRQQSLQREGK